MKSVEQKSMYEALQDPGFGASRPQGWIRSWLKTQASGLTGHLDVAGYPFDTRLWACKAIPHLPYAAPWWPYEQTAYWVDGLFRCGVLTEDKKLIRAGLKQFEYVLSHADTDGYLGPKSCKSEMVAGRWSHMIFFRALIAYAESAPKESPRIVRALSRHYLGHPHDHSGHRDICNIEILCWLHRRTGREEFVRMAEESWVNYQKNGDDDDLQLRSEALAADEPATAHGVTFCETVKLGAILYTATGKKAYLRDTQNGFKKLEKHHMLVTGAPSSSENLRGQTALDSHETCDIADYTWAAGWLLQATGAAALADQIERACFNAHPSAVTKDFHQLQYFSCPNQVVLRENSCHALAVTGGKWMCYAPKPGTECCTAQVTRIMPNYAARMWLQKNGNPVAALYGPSQFTFRKERLKVTITEETDYPFNDEIVFTVNASRPVRFPFRLRIPGWCRNARLLVNDCPRAMKLPAGRFVTVSRVWRNGDRVELIVPMQITTRNWPDNGITVERGPLVYALPVPAQQSVYKEDTHQTKEFPALRLEPDGPWNYGLTLEGAALAAAAKVEFAPVTDNPFAESPVRIQIPARRIPGWTLRRAKTVDTIGGRLIDPARNKWEHFWFKKRGDFVLTPPLPSRMLRTKTRQKDDTIISLVPVGCTLLRVTTFPKV
jgi:hypothetical protein